MGNVLYLAVILLSGMLGFKGYHFLWSVAFGMVAFQVAYMTEIALCLTRRGIPTRTGKFVWFPSTVKTVVG